jgi:hypothetical protein
LLHDEWHDRQPPAARSKGAKIMTSKTNLVSACAALLLSSLFLGSAVVPATVVAAVPVTAAQHA